MDKVKIVLDVLKKHHFWALVVLVVVLGLTVYMGAAQKLQSQYDSRVSVLKNASDQTDAIGRDPTHPNEPLIANLKAKKEQQEQKVLEAWRKFYEQQKAINPWPKKLGSRFLAKIENLKPDEEIPSYFREIYSEEIKKAVPELLETVDYRRLVPLEPAEVKGAPPAEAAGRASPGQLGAAAAQENMKPVGTITWKESGLIEAEFELPAKPTSAQVRLKQEDYWVYRALLTIISKTNGDAKTRADAAIKEIITLKIGQAAAQHIATNKLTIVPEAAAGAAGGAMGPVGTGPPGEAMGPPTGPGGPYGASSLGPGGASSAVSDDQLLNSRYVDAHMQPLSAEQTKNSPPYTEFNMMPVVMLLRIDQRKIPDLLVQCANSTMPVEPFLVRINPDKSQGAGSGLSGGMGAMPQGAPGRMEGGMGMEGPARGPMGPGPMGPGMGMGPPTGGGSGLLGADDEEESPYAVTVEIRGIIYLYKPPLEPTSVVTSSQP